MPRKDIIKEIMTPVSFIKVAVLENAIEFQVVTSILEERQIPHRIRSFHDTAYDGLFQFQKGWGEIYAPEAYKEDIINIVEEIRTQDPLAQDENIVK